MFWLRSENQWEDPFLAVFTGKSSHSEDKSWKGNPVGGGLGLMEVSACMQESMCLHV